MNYPFTAIVGQEKLKLALLLCAVNPAIGGVLIRGDKGTAKSTAARALAAVAPTILKVADCPFNCASDTPLLACTACEQPHLAVVEAQVPFVNLPLGATEDRVVGSLDLEGVLAERKKRLQPGLLAAAHQGILYIDEVNLLPDHLVDVLLDVAAMGVNTIQREGLSISHPSRFSLIGTMNPEEGNLRPQFLDRFGLVVEVAAPRDVAERTEVVRRRIAFEASPEKFASQWAAQEQALQQQLVTAKKLLPSVSMPESLLSLISQLCTELDIVSLRADIVMYKTALTLAALANRREVTAEDIRQSAELVLTHRKRKKPFSDSRINEERLDELMQQAPENPKDQQKHNPPPQPGKEPSPQVENQPGSSTEDSAPAMDDLQGKEEETQQGQGAEEQVFGAAPAMGMPPIAVESPESALLEAVVGRRSYAVNAQRGMYVRATPNAQPTDLAVEATIYHALQREPEEFSLSRNDLHQKVRKGKVGNLILFVVDASGSMAASRRMEAVKGTVLSLLTDAYQKRDIVGVISFRGVEAQLLLPPTNSVELAEQAMRSLPTGGRTPLPHALQLALQLVSKLEPGKDFQPLLVILSDGKANVALPGGGDPWNQTRQLAAQLKDLHIASLVLDTDSNYLQLGKAEELAEQLGGRYVKLNELSAENIRPLVHEVL